jgi:DNA repair protein RadC
MKHKNNYVQEVKIISRICEETGTDLTTPNRIFDLWQKCVATADWFDGEKETVVVFNLNTKYKVKNWQMVSVGTVNECAVTVREAYRSAVATLAYALVIAHNHPSGNPAPSSVDHDFTRRMKEAGRIMSIQCLDHVIIGNAKDGNQPYYSFNEAGYL